MPPGVEWVPDCPDWCFLRVQIHCGYWLGDGCAIETNPGDVLALSPLRTGCFRASRLGKVALHHFRFSPDLAAGLLTPIEHNRFDALSVLPSHAVRHFPASSAGAAIWAGLQPGRAVPASLQNRVDLLRIVAELLFADVQPEETPASVFQNGRLKLRLLLNQMSEEEFLRITPGDLAARCGLSLVQTNRLFRQILGESIRGRHELIRLRRARRLLAETNRSVESIAIEAGFRDARAFCGAFKRRFALTPSEWRASIVT